MWIKAGRKRLLTAFMCLSLICGLPGCGNNVSEQDGRDAAPKTEGETDQPPTQWEQLSSSVKEKLADEKFFYRQAAKADMTYEAPENLRLGGRWTAFLGADGAVRYSLYQLDTPVFGVDDYTLVQTADGDGNLKETKLQAAFLNELFDADYACNVRLYPIAGHTDFVLVHYRAEDSQVRIIDEEGALIAGFTLPETIAEEYKEAEYSGLLVPAVDMIADEAYNLYIVWKPSDGGVIRFMASDREGKLLWEESLSGDDIIEGMVLLPDQTIGCLLYRNGEDRKPSSYRLVKLNSQDGLQLAAEIKAEGLIRRKCVTCFDDRTLLYANQDGLYRCSYDASDTQELFLWAENGVNMDALTSIIKMQVQPNGDIEILFRYEQDYTYLRLKLTDEKEPVTELVFAVGESNRRNYQNAVADFNREHSDCQIRMTAYEESSKLLTELTAGKGPVLIDTNLISFADNGELWECLDSAMAGWNLEDVLLKKTLSGGQIDGKQYGLSFYWQLISFATVSYRDESWNYESFLKYLNENNNLDMLYEEQSPEGFMTWFLSRGLDESLFLDAEAGKAYFDSEQFAEAAALARRLAAERQRADDMEQVERIRQGSCLGEFVYLYYASAIAYYDARLGEAVNYVGFPGRDGSCHYISMEAPVVIRKTASDKEKDAALLFLRGLLEKDVQADLVKKFGFSVRKDVFEEQLKNVEDEVTYIIEGEKVLLSVDKEHIKDRIFSLYDKAEPYPSMPDGIGSALAEELQEYFHGVKRPEEVQKVLQNRVQLYLNERK